MSNPFNEVRKLEKGNDYICVVDNSESHVFSCMEDANNFIAYQWETLPFDMNIIGYRYQIYSIKCNNILAG